MLQISREELQEWTEEGRDFLLVDVREEEEHKEFNLGGDLMPLSELSQHIDRFDTPKPVVFYCRKGIRSQIAIQRLLRKYPDGTFYNLSEGIQHSI